MMYSEETCLIYIRRNPSSQLTSPTNQPVSRLFGRVVEYSVESFLTTHLSSQHHDGMYRYTRSHLHLVNEYDFRYIGL